MSPNMIDYESTRDGFALEVPAKFNFSRDVIDIWAEDPDKLALLWIDDHGREIRKTFWDLAVGSRRVANVLHAGGVERGDIVIVILPRLIEWWLVHLACLRMGAIFSPGTPQLTPKDVEYRASASGACCLVTDATTAERLDGSTTEPPLFQSRFALGGERSGWSDFDGLLSGASEDFQTVDTGSDEDALLFFTSGTAGPPKMTLHTHASYPIGHRITGTFWLDLGPDDLHWNLSDTGWAKAAWSSFYGPWNLGAAVFVHHTERFDPVRTLELLGRHPITTLCAGPTHYRLFVLEDLESFRFSNLRHSVAAGEPLNPEVIAAWKRATGNEIRDGYGQTETVLLVGNYPCLEIRPGSMGKPAPGFDVQIVDDAGVIVSDGNEGDIAVRVKPERPVGLFKEYWNDPERTREVYRGVWYITGDRGYRDEDGYLWFVGRADDVILSAGYRIGPFEVESALLEHEAVAESAVVSSPDEVRGEIVKAFVILKPGRSGNEQLVRQLQQCVKEATAPYKYPRRIEFVDSLPKTVSGKIRRNILREREWKH